MSLIEQLVDSLDIDAFEDVQTSVVIIKNPVTGQPTAASIEIAGPEHPVRKQLLMDRMRKSRAAFQRSGKLDVSDPLDDVEKETDFMVSCTVGWSRLVSAGQPLSFSAESVRALYTNSKKQWLRAQVKKAMEDTERFISGSAKA